MTKFIITLIRKALTLIVDSFKQIQGIWGLKNKFESEERSPRGELLLAISILGNIIPVLSPILGGTPFFISLILIAISIITYWLLRSGISDPRLWTWTGSGILLESVGLILGGFYLPYTGLIQHIFKNVIFRTILIAAGSGVWAATTYVVSAQPGDFEGEAEPVMDIKAPNMNEYGIDEPRKRFKFPDFSDYGYYQQWENAEFQHNK